jgi:hypothetical protein
MTQVSDRIRVGKVFDRRFQGANANPSTSGPGAATSPVFVYSVTPLTMQLNNYATSQTPVGAGNLTLTAGTGVTSSVQNGVTIFAADMARNVRVVSAANDSARTFTVYGYDAYGQTVVENIAGGNIATVQGKKAFKSVYRIAVDAACAGANTVGTGDIIGLPYAVASANYIWPKFNSVLAQDAGTFVGAVTTNPATAVTGDVRGTYSPSAATDGAKILTLLLFINDVDTVAGLYGVNQFAG